MIFPLRLQSYEGRKLPQKSPLVYVGNYAMLTIRLLIGSTNEKSYFMLFTKNFEIVCI